MRDLEGVSHHTGTRTNPATPMAALEPSFEVFTCHGVGVGFRRRSGLLEFAEKEDNMRTARREGRFGPCDAFLA